MVGAQTPTLAKIKNEISLDYARALLSIAVCEVCDFFNVGKNMSDTQVAVTVDLILESFWYLRLEEIKYCFRRAMRRERLYDRLDGNIIIGWLAEYDAERTEEAIRISEQREAEAANLLPAPSEDTMSLAQYMELLRQRADEGDGQAAEELAAAEKWLTPQKGTCSEAEKKREFRKRYLREYYSKQNSNNGQYKN